MKIFRSLAIGVMNIDLLLSGLCAIALVGLTTAGVFMRYFANDPIIWLEEVQLLLFVWVAFFGAAAAFRTNNHIAIEVVVELFPIKVQRIIEILDSILVLALLVLVMYWEYSRGMSLLRTGRTTSILGIPTALNYFGVAAASFFMIVHFVAQRAAMFKSWFKAGAAAGETNNA